MLTFEQWDFIADSYIPALALISVTMLVIDFNRFGAKNIIKPALGIFVSITLVYLLMIIDNFFGVGSKFNLDYSTHTALVLVFVIYLGVRDSFSAMLINLTAVAYGYLMLYQQYHTLADIVVTALIVTPILVLIQYKLTSQHKPPVVESSADCD